MNMSFKRWQRILLLVALPVLIITVCIYVYTGQHGLRCIFFEVTGFYCPGCGSGRALYALLHRDWKDAFLHNILFLPMSIPAAAVFLYEYLRILIPALHWKPVFFPRWLEVGCCILLFAFWFLRNLPSLSFLAP